MTGRRTAAVWVVLMGIAFMVSGCGQPVPGPASDSAAVPPSAEVSTAETPVDGDWLVSDLPAEMESLNPFTTTDAYSGGVNGLIIESLIELDNETLERKPRLAESWTISEDKTAYTFTLRPGVVFSDGVPLSAADVKFSFDTIKDPAVDAPSLRNYYQDVVSCEVVDDRTVKFVCDKPYFKHLGMLGGLPIIPKHIYGTGDFNHHPNNRNPIGTGPYVLESWETGRQLTLARNESYWREKPHIVKIVYKIITNPDAAFQELERHGLDTLDPLSMTEETWVGRASSSGFEREFNKFTYNFQGYRYIGYNQLRPLFQDKRVRQALTMLLDRETILNELMHGLGQIVACPFFPDEPEYNKNIKPWPFDPARARALLQEAGWADTNNDGILDKDGAPLAFELQFTASLPIHEQTATVFQEELAAAGIRMTIRQLEWATFLQNVENMNFDAALLGWGTVVEPDPYQIWHSSQAVPGGSNHVSYKNPEVDAILEAARLEFDRDKRCAMYHRFCEILHEDQPYTFLFGKKALLAVDKRFHGIKIYPYGTDALEWWVPKEMQRYTK